jgi:hypothetical protein
MPGSPGHHPPTTAGCWDGCDCAPRCPWDFPRNTEHWAPVVMGGWRTKWRDWSGSPTRVPVLGHVVTLKADCAQGQVLDAVHWSLARSCPGSRWLSANSSIHPLRVAVLVSRCFPSSSIWSAQQGNRGRVTDDADNKYRAFSVQIVWDGQQMSLLAYRRGAS